MEKRILTASILLILPMMGLAQDWGYEPPIGPDEWSNISTSYAECGNGMMQSPIAIVSANALDDEVSGLIILNSAIQRNGTLANNGYTVEFQAGETSDDLTNQPTIAIAHAANDPFFSGRILGDNYYLYSLKFHWGSSDSQGAEHRINGDGGVGEVHFIYYNTKYNNFLNAMSQNDGLTIVAFRLQICANSDFSTIFGANNEHLDKLSVNGSSVTGIPWSLSDLHECSMLFSGVCNDLFYVYFGSLTYPPCSQSVIWWVAKEMRCVTSAQLQILRQQRVSEGGQILVSNYRPLQDLNGRTIIQTGNKNNGTPASIPQVSDGL